jgi:hypothetical protein
VEHWAFRNNRFQIIERILEIPRQVAAQGKRAQVRLLRELRVPRRNAPRHEQSQVKGKRKTI